MNCLFIIYLQNYFDFQVENKIILFANIEPKGTHFSKANSTKEL